MADLLNVEHLSVSFFTPAGEAQAVRDVSFSLKAGEVLAIVGESGCGKSVLCKSILRLLPQTAKIKSGKIIVDGTDITAYREREMTALRGSLFSMVFQDPMTALDPTMTIGAQIAEAVLAHRPKLEKSAVRARVIELLELVGIDHAQERMALYPHSFSGGMRERVVLAIALAGDPRILFADEPTTALDVTIQAQILDLLRDVQQKLGTATVFVTHDLGVVARVADRVAVMYAGKIIETGTAEDIFYDPRHPYTWGLHFCARFRRSVRLAARSTPSPACRRRSLTRRKATPSPPAMNTPSPSTTRKRRRCFASATRTMPQHGCSTNARRRSRRRWEVRDDKT